MLAGCPETKFLFCSSLHQDFARGNEITVCCRLAGCPCGPHCRSSLQSYQPATASAISSSVAGGSLVGTFLIGVSDEQSTSISETASVSSLGAFSYIHDKRCFLLGMVMGLGWENTVMLSSFSIFIQTKATKDLCKSNLFGYSFLPSQRNFNLVKESGHRETPLNRQAQCRWNGYLPCLSFYAER